MEKRELFTEARIQQKKAFFDLSEVYRFAYKWLKWRKYDITEKKYKEKHNPNGKEMEIKWEAWKEIDSYSAFQIDIRWELYGVTDAKVNKDGKEVKMQTGEINVYVSAYLVLDYESKWEESPFLKFLRSFYEKYLYAGTVVKLKGDVWVEGWDFYNEVKAMLNLPQNPIHQT